MEQNESDRIWFVQADQRRVLWKKKHLIRDHIKEYKRAMYIFWQGAFYKEKPENT